MRTEALGHLKVSKTPPGIELGTSQLMVQCLNQLRTARPQCCAVAIRISRVASCLRHKSAASLHALIRPARHGAGEFTEQLRAAVIADCTLFQHECATFRTTVATKCHLCCIGHSCTSRCVCLPLTLAAMCSTVPGLPHPVRGSLRQFVPPTRCYATKLHGVKIHNVSV
jgi:hypothetical protein